MAPTAIGGEKPGTSFRAGLDARSSFAALAFRYIARPAVCSQSAASPQPDTAVKEPAFYVVSRMNRRLSAARSCGATGSVRSGRAELIGRS
jgi:hypothetical protein